MSLADVQSIKALKLAKQNAQLLSGNLVDYKKFITGSFINNANGALQTNASYSYYDYIPIKPDKTYYISVLRYMSFYDTNKNFISGLGVSVGSAYVTAPSNAIYMRISCPTANISSSFIVREVINATKWLNKKLSSFGDSITQQNMWQPYISSKFTLNLLNYGVGGTRVSDGTGSDTTALCRDERINLIDSTSDIITVMGGTNDWAQNAVLGSATRTNVDTTTFYGASNVMFKKLITKFPTARILCMSTPFGLMPNRAGWTDTTGLINNQNLMSIDYGKALMDSARWWGIPTVDIGGQAGWNEVNIATYITNDGNYLHPNDAGGQRVSSLVIGKLNSLEPVS